MSKREDTTLYHRQLDRRRLAEALYDMETYWRLEGRPEFAYDEELDVYRFPEDGRFAFCEEFADWMLLGKRGFHWRNPWADVPAGSSRPPFSSAA